MTAEPERDHSRVVGRGAERAPQDPGDYSAQTLARSLWRRVRTQALLTAMAVMLVAGGGGVAVWATLSGDSPVAATPTPAATPSPAMTRPAPVAQVWPEAVRTIPMKLPNGRKGHPRILIDDRTLLLETWQSFEKADALYTYDLKTGQTRKITDIRTPKGVFASGYAVGEGRVVWQTIDKMRTSFWSVPLSGGQPAAIEAETPIKGRGDGPVVIGDKIAFSLHEGGVFTLPLKGGAVTPVKGAERHHILSWPWVGTPSLDTPGNQPSFAEILNVESGKTSKALVRPDEEHVRCGVTTCTGWRVDRTFFYRLRDGSQERDLPQPTFGALVYDRFTTVLLEPGGQGLVDLATGRVGDLGLYGGSSINPGADPYDRLIAYELQGRYLIIDLAKIR
ncbi:hypothetical protein ACQEVF_30840 [Nonomuraea polychroma]|uniref:hypothetical protein n=1 Tax=Nonomuraea polychroma TaxID=46176 RepID=UPI003D936BBC